MQLGWGGEDPRCGTFQKAPASPSWKDWGLGEGGQVPWGRSRGHPGRHSGQMMVLPSGEGKEEAIQTSLSSFSKHMFESFTHSCVTTTKWPCPQTLNFKESWLNSGNKKGSRGQWGYLRDKGETAQAADKSQDNIAVRMVGELEFKSQAGYLKPRASFPY